MISAMMGMQAGLCRTLLSEIEEKDSLTEEIHVNGWMFCSFTSFLTVLSYVRHIRRWVDDYEMLCATVKERSNCLVYHNDIYLDI